MLKLIQIDFSIISNGLAKIKTKSEKLENSIKIIEDFNICHFKKLKSKKQAIQKKRKIKQKIKIFFLLFIKKTLYLNKKII